jgi:hypothetical protein
LPVRSSSSSSSSPPVRPFEASVRWRAMRELLLFAAAFPVNRSRKTSGCAFARCFFRRSYLNPSHRRSRPSFPNGNSRR